MAGQDGKPQTEKLAWTSPELETLGDVGDVLNNTGAGGDGGTPGDNAS